MMLLLTGLAEDTPSNETNDWPLALIGLGFIVVCVLGIISLLWLALHRRKSFYVALASLILVGGFSYFLNTNIINDYPRSTNNQSVSPLTYTNDVTATPNGILCNEKSWTSCPTGQRFYCPPTGDAQCIDDTVSIAGTGSMYPTFPKGQGKTLQEQVKEIVATQRMTPYTTGYQVGRGDIVSVENEKIRELTKKLYGEPSGVIKRIVGVSEDSIELRDGIVYLNGQPLKEPYTAESHSTFGQTFLTDCKVITIPRDSIFIMGDNRKGSGDSREFGFVSLRDIQYILSLEGQKGSLDKNWRDTSEDFEQSTKIKINKQQYLDLLNEARRKVGVSPLKYQPKLEESGFKRGRVMLQYNDFFYEATTSGYTMENSMEDVGYSNIVWGETNIQGYYEAEELIENQFQFPATKDFLFNKDFQEVGMAEVEGLLNGCPAQVIVQHFAGYIPPNYPEADIVAWRQTLANLDSIIPSWEDARNKGWFNEQELERLLNLFYRERAIASNILSKMEASVWLTKEEQYSIEEFNRLSEESAALTNKLNSR